MVSYPCLQSLYQEHIEPAASKYEEEKKKNDEDLCILFLFLKPTQKINKKKKK